SPQSSSERRDRPLGQSRVPSVCLPSPAVLAGTSPARGAGLQSACAVEGYDASIFPPASMHERPPSPGGWTPKPVTKGLSRRVPSVGEERADSARTRSKKKGRITQSSQR